MERDVEADDESTPWLFVPICISMMRLPKHCNPPEDSKVIRKWGSALHLGRLICRIKNSAQYKRGKAMSLQMATRMPPWPRDDNVGVRVGTVLQRFVGDPVLLKEMLFLARSREIAPEKLFKGMDARMHA